MDGAFVSAPTAQRQRPVKPAPVIRTTIAPPVFTTRVRSPREIKTNKKEESGALREFRRTVE